jgi:hypothetical protein
MHGGEGGAFAFLNIHSHIAVSDFPTHFRQKLAEPLTTIKLALFAV